MRVAPGGVRVAVRLTPRARSERLEGIARLADGSAVLRVSVTAPPEDGRANEALLRLLAKELGLARRDLAIFTGQKSRNKLVQISGEPAELVTRLGARLAALPSA